jgi:hypothetical protein
MSVASREKLSVSLDRDVARRIRAAAGHGGISEWLNDAAMLRLQGDMLSRLSVDHGVTLTAELLAEVDAQWPAVD